MGVGSMDTGVSMNHMRVSIVNSEALVIISSTQSITRFIIRFLVGFIFYIHL